MRIVICPDKFAGTLSAAEAADAIAQGWRSVRPGDQLVLVPLADGGEGTLDAVAHARPDAVRHEVEVADARGIATTAAWLEVHTPPTGETTAGAAGATSVAVVEVAQACGLSRLSSEDRDPLRATTYGVGQLLTAVLAHDVGEIIVGLGGSATVDGGVGMVSAVTGHAVRRSDGNAVRVGGRWVADVHEIRPGAARVVPGTDRPARRGHVEPVITIASDVDNPLLGPRGAAAVFGPQKGATPGEVSELEAALHRWADVAERDLPGGPWRDRAGAGAAGGLGFALMALFDGRVRNGADVVAELIGLELEGADVVVTGEGSLDAQTLGGKGPERIRRRAEAAGATTVAVAGVITDDAAARFDIAESLGPEGLSDPVGTLTAASARAASRVQNPGPDD